MTDLSHPIDRADPETTTVVGDVLSRALNASPVTGATRNQLMDLLEAPRGRVDRDAYEWADVGPGLKLHLVSEDAARGVKRCLVWGIPGAKTARHGHSAAEVILVLEGNLQDDKGSYGPGEICRSSAGDVHQEQVVGEIDCVCFVVYYGELIPV